MKVGDLVRYIDPGSPNFKCSTHIVLCTKEKEGTTYFTIPHNPDFWIQDDGDWETVGIVLSDEQLEYVQGGMNLGGFSNWRVNLINDLKI